MAAGFLIVATSLCAGLYPAGAVLAVYRLRWQIELAFKRFKSLPHIDRLPARIPSLWRVRSTTTLLLAMLVPGPLPTKAQAARVLFRPGISLGPAPAMTRWVSAMDQSFRRLVGITTT